MDTDEWRRMKQLFGEALEYMTEEREAFLDEACGDDAALRSNVEALLASNEKTEKFLEPPLERSAQLVGTRLGQYLLTRVLSAGGMGMVFEAQQEHPSRTVAVKVMHEGIASPSSLRRFEYEAEILARLRHPNIAHVIEAGTHGEVPYFVMEFIPEASTITAYARKNDLSIRDRLELFIQVCEAVHHGHQKGIIHRDLKPSNILVDSSGQVKVIDFGVARATDKDIKLTTAHTDVGQLIGTVQYMSPEQCKADPDDLDLRSDVYALGVVLYELLCEALPYDVSKAAVFEATRLICEVEPRPPSSVRRALRGDVETIVLKALEKQKGRRYQSVASFSTDIQRHLSGDVILARPAGPATRIYKVVKRNPVLSASMGVAVAALSGFLLYVVFWSLPQIKEERNRAVEAWSEADLEADKARAINEFLADMLKAANPNASGREVKVVEVLNRASKRVGRDFPDQPEIEASLRKTLGITYESLGLFDEAEVQLDRAVELFEEIYGKEHAGTLRVTSKQSALLVDRGRVDEAIAALIRTLERQTRCLGKEDPETVETRITLAWAYLEDGKPDAAEEMFGDSDKELERILGSHDSKTFRAKNVLSCIYTDLARYDEAESLLRALVADQGEALGEEDPMTLASLFNLAKLLKENGAVNESVEHYQRLLELDTRVYGPDNPNTLYAKQGLASALGSLGHHARAEAMLREVLEARRQCLPEDHPETLSSMRTLAIALQAQGKIVEAENLISEVVEKRRRILGNDNIETMNAVRVHAVTLAKLGRLPEAEPLFTEAHKTIRRLLGDAHPTTLEALKDVACTYQSQGKLDEAESTFRIVIDQYTRVQGKDHYRTQNMNYMLANLLSKMSRFDEAEAIYREVLEFQRRVMGHDSAHIRDTLHSLGVLLLTTGEFAEAEPFLDEACAIAETTLPEKNSIRLNMQLNFGYSLLMMDRYEEAEPPLLSCGRLSLEALGPRHKTTVGAAGQLVDLYELWGKPEKAKEWLCLLGEDM